MKRDYKTLFWVLASLLVAFCACAVDPLYVGRFTGNAGGTTNVVGNMLRAELFGVTPYRPALPLAAGAISPTNLTDSTSAIQTLLNGAAMLASTNQEFATVRLPWGVYLCKSQLLIPPRVNLEGEGGYLHSAGWGGTIAGTFTNAPFTILWFPSYYTNDGIIMTNGKAGQNVLRKLEICGGTNCFAPLGNSFSDPISFEMVPSAVLRQGRGLILGPALGGGQFIEDVSVCGFTINVDVIGGNAMTFNRCQWGGGDFQFQCTNANGIYDQFVLNTPGSGSRRGGIEYVFNGMRNMTIINPDTLDGFGNQAWNSQVTIIGGNYEYDAASHTEAPARCYVANGVGPTLTITNGWWQANQPGTGVGLLTNNGIWNVCYNYGLGTSSSLQLAIIGSRITSAVDGALQHTFVHSGIQGAFAKVTMMNCQPNWVVDTQNGLSTFILSDDTVYPPEASGIDAMGWERHDSSGNNLGVIPIFPPAYTNIFVADKQFTYVSGKLVSVFSPTNTGVAAALYSDTLISGLATNGSTVYWPDLSFNQLNLTNQAANTTWPTTAWTNGFPSVRTAVGKYLIQTGYANTQPFEIVVVSQYYGISVSDAILFDSATGGTRTTLEVDDSANGDKDTFYAGNATVTGSVHAKNKFRIIDVVFNGASSSIYTNGVLEVSGNPGANNPSGFTLSGVGGTPTSNGSPSDTTFLLALSGTNTAANRSLLTSYLKNRFNVVP